MGGVSARRILPTICVQSCRVAQVSDHALWGRGSHTEESGVGTSILLGCVACDCAMITSNILVLFRLCGSQVTHGFAASCFSASVISFWNSSTAGTSGERSASFAEYRQTAGESRGLSRPPRYTTNMSCEDPISSCGCGPSDGHGGFEGSPAMLGLGF